MEKSGAGEFAFWIGDGSVERAGGSDPLGDDGLRVGYRFLVGCAVGQVAGELGDLDEEGVVFLALADDEFVAHVSRGVHWGVRFDGSWSGARRLEYLFEDGE